MKRLVSLIVILTFVGLGGVLAAQEQPASSTASPLERLVKRVQEHYTYLQGQNWTKAETYLTEDSKEYYRDATKSSFVGFRIGSVKLAENGLEAKVDVTLKALIPPVPAPVDLPTTSVWRMVNGEWYRELERPRPEAASSPFDVQSSKPAPPPPPEYLKFKGKNYSFGRFEQGTTKTARFPFSNLSNKSVRITEVETRCDCLKVQGLKEAYKPGESGEVAIVFDSTRYNHEYDQTVFVHAEPDRQLYHLRVFGYIYEKGLGEYYEKQSRETKR